ncbi:RNA helicase [Aphelenchoides fujianensis]|nr:RNA helicase [Aphelenchoides fujianensis]
MRRGSLHRRAKMSSTPNATKRRLVDYEDTPSSTPTSSGTTTPTQVRKVAAEMSGMGVNGAPTPQRRPVQRENSEPKGLRISKSDVLQNGSSTNNNNRPQPSSSNRILQKVTVLPVQQHKEKIVGAIFDHPTTIFVGETGSGKSTLIPQFVLDYILKPGEQVAVTQPRRVAAFSLAKKVAEDRKVELGQKVGYKFRFENVTSPKTRLTYMTDGMLLEGYSCIVLDEVHERSMASDVLLFILRKIQKARKKRPLKLVLMSATIDAEELCAYFDDAPAFSIPGRTFPIFYTQMGHRRSSRRTDKRTWRCGPTWRKVVVATNIAETSITIPDIKVVIDGGKVKQKIYLPSKRTNTLSVVPTSRSQAIQRAGRAGRVSPGCCFRLYTKADYEDMDTERLLMNLISVGIKVPNDIDLLDNPKKAEWCHALDELYMLDLIDFTNEPGVYQITKEAFLRTDLQKKMGFACYERHCLVEGLIVAACCSVEDFVVREELLDDKTRQEQRQLMKACYSP